MVPERLLTRDGFREGVFARDGNICVLCEEPAQDAHHIIERKLWPDGGYYLSNGASVCGPCHELCETTAVTVEEVREAAGIKVALLPPQFDSGDVIDKWGNTILPNGQRLRGELFDDQGCQVNLKKGGFLPLFTIGWIKYPRTLHLPWSPGATSDDKVLTNVEHFKGRHVVVTTKMDGENTTLYHDGLHARSLTTSGGPERNWIKRFWAEHGYDIPEGWRVCGENLFAFHSIFYKDLPSYFMAFSIWDEHNMCLSWKDTVEWLTLLGIQVVPVLYTGPWDQTLIEDLIEDRLQREDQEGYVVRVADSFRYRDFSTSVAKFVRVKHVTTDDHWKHKAITKNGLAGDFPVVEHMDGIEPEPGR